MHAPLALHVEPRGSVQVWTIDAPATRNALSRAVVHELARNVERLGTDRPTPRAVVLRGGGEQSFSAGADLKERVSMSPAEVDEFLARLRATLRSIEASDVAFIAFLNGTALGGGLELALACDVRIAAPSAVVGLTETTLGIIPGAGGTQRLPRLVGPGVAKALILTGRRVGAEEALRLGLISAIGSLDDALAVAEAVAANAPLAVAAAKHAIDEGLTLELDRALDVERRHYEVTLRSRDRLEGLAAFAAKRKPVYRGE